MLTVKEWLEDKINQGNIHKEYLSIYTWIEYNYQKYQESINAAKKEESGVQGSAGEDSQKRGHTDGERRGDSGECDPEGESGSKKGQSEFKESQDAEGKVREFPCLECGAKRNFHKKTCSLFKGNPNIKVL